MDKKKVLIIDDSQFFGKIVMMNLELEDGIFIVECALDGTTGIQKAKEFVPDLILLDRFMPDKDGFEVLKELKNDESVKNIPVIMLSGKAEDKNGNETPKGDYELYLTKPIENVELVAKIQEILNKNAV